MRSVTTGWAAGLLAVVLLIAPEAWAQKPKGKAPKEPAKSAAEVSDVETPAKGKGEKPAIDPKAPKDAAAGVVKVDTDKEKEMKTYTFGPQEVEGRLKSPQIQYFLRRVRAEFEAGALGHRSFMRELRHTRHHTSVR